MGRCELGKLVDWLDPGMHLRRLAVVTDRTATTEGRIRREAGLCIGCARCERVCEHASDCTFCGLCVLVCPTGALTAPGEAGIRWLAGRKAKSSLPSAVLPPEVRRALTSANIATVPDVAGVLWLFDAGGHVVLIRGVADLRAGLSAVSDDLSCATAASFNTEPHPLYTQRESELLARHAQEHGQLPPANDLSDDLF
jgi:hypothetical protein